MMKAAVIKSGQFLFGDRLLDFDAEKALEDV